MKSDKVYEHITHRMKEKSSEELLAIWKENDRGLWADMAFKAVEEILVNRKIPIPLQDPIKNSPPPSHSLVGSWEKPYLSMAFYFAFLFWIGVLHPIFFLGGHYTNLIASPLYPNLLITLTQGEFIQDMNIYYGLWQLLIFVELCLLCLGSYTGYLLWEEKFHAVFWTKIYLLLLFLFLNITFLFFNFYSMAEEIIQIKISVIDLSIDWNFLLNEKYSDRHWEFAWRSLKSYLIPLACTIVWFIYFSKSNWIANRCCK